MVLALYPLLIIVLTLYGAKRINDSDDFLHQSRMIRAAACMGIILHHLAQISTNYGTVNKGLITSFNYLGFLFTSIFFFYSGFGLIFSFLNKPDYLETFLGKRLPYVLIPFWVANLFGVIINNILFPTGQKAGDLVLDVLGISLYNSFGWFIIEIVILYLLFYFLFKKIKNSDIALILLCIAVVLIILMGFFRGHDPNYDKSHWFQGEWWYNSTIAFAAGMLYARFKSSLDDFFKKHYKVCTVISAILFAITMQLSVYALWYLGYYHGNSALGRRDAAITLIAQIAACISFDILILLVSMKVAIGNRALKLISGFSLELFLVHGYLVNWFFKIDDLSEPLIYALVIICSLLCAFLLSKLDSLLIKVVSQILTAPKKKRDKIAILKIGGVLVSLLVVAFVIIFTRHILFAKNDFDREMAALKVSSIGDEVNFGHYDMDFTKLGKEPVTWIVLEKDENEIYLLSKQGLGGSYYNQKHAKTTWGVSDMRLLLNSQEYLEMFNKYELERLVKNNGDRIYLLTPEEAQEFFSSDEERELSITQAAEAKGTNINYMSKTNYWDVKDYRSSWWWLKGSSTEQSVYAPIVTSEGVIETDTKVVNKPSGAIRPVVRVMISGG